MQADPERYVRKIEPLAHDWRSATWATGRFDNARRAYTPAIAGEIRTPNHLLMVTMQGGAERLEVDSECGHRYRGDERAGAVSFVPAHCGRRLRMYGVHSEWASLELDPKLFDLLARDTAGHQLELATFTNVHDPLLAGIVAEFARLHAHDGALDPVWCDAMSLAVTHCLLRRHGRVAEATYVTQRLPAWRVRRLTEYVDARIADGVTIAALAQVAGLSTGHLHRSFRATLGQTPLEFINARRVHHAVHLLATTDATVTEIAGRVGFASPSHFARIFRRATGQSPSAFGRR